MIENICWKLISSITIDGGASRNYLIDSVVQADVCIPIEVQNRDDSILNICIILWESSPWWTTEVTHLKGGQNKEANNLLPVVHCSQLWQDEHLHYRDIAAVRPPKKCALSCGWVMSSYPYGLGNLLVNFLNAKYSVLKSPELNVCFYQGEDGGGASMKICHWQPMGHGTINRFQYSSWPENETLLAVCINGVPRWTRGARVASADTFCGVPITAPSPIICVPAWAERERK